ncbi:MAG TPA: DUF2339 domain-containing protein, partial [Longimicrobiaceae bacterium]|nr:DUF2339 domain-containing protein [Longimicrobiaceae bacterium]
GAPPPAIALGQKPAPAPARVRRPVPDFLWDGEFWLNSLGIGLLLLGVAFLFRYSIEQGWLTPAVRVAFGLVVGAVLLALGLRMEPRRRRFTAVLLGGGIATFYIVGFAAFQLYTLIGYSVAFAGMVAVTLLAFFLAIRRDQPALALTGVLGGLKTPFLLYTGTGSFAGVIAYTCVILALTTALFIYRGWRSVLWAGIVGGWTVFLVSYTHGLPPDPAEATGDRWVLQSALLFAWTAFWAVPIAREVLLLRPLGSGMRPASAADTARAAWHRDTELHIHLLSISTPMVALVMSWLIWSLPMAEWGWIVLGCAAAYGLAARGLLRVSRLLAEAQLLAGSLLLAVGTLAVFEGSALLLALAVQVAALHHLGRRLTRPSVSGVAHLLAGGVAGWLILRLVTAVPTGGVGSLADLAALVLLLAASSAVHVGRELHLYRFFVHLAFLGWLWREIDPLPNGAGLVSVAWGLYALGLLVVGLRHDLALLQKVAIGTLLLLVVKLFVVDLAALEALYRILLFLGLGGLFLFLSYSLQTLWKAKPGVAGR